MQDADGPLESFTKIGRRRSLCDAASFAVIWDCVWIVLPDQTRSVTQV